MRRFVSFVTNTVGMRRSCSSSSSATARILSSTEWPSTATVAELLLRDEHPDQPLVRGDRHTVAQLALHAELVEVARDLAGVAPEQEIALEVVDLLDHVDRDDDVVVAEPEDAADRGAGRSCRGRSSFSSRAGPLGAGATRRERNPARGRAATAVLPSPTPAAARRGARSVAASTVWFLPCRFAWYRHASARSTSSGFFAPSSGQVATPSDSVTQRTLLRPERRRRDALADPLRDDGARGIRGGHHDRELLAAVARHDALPRLRSEHGGHAAQHLVAG